MTNPLVTIVICTHNRADLLRRALLSAINQTYTNIEIIVSDDASVDDTEKLVESYIEQFNKVKIIYRRNKVNSGACYTRNKGIELARGEFITGLDDDDSFSEDRIQNFIDLYDDSYSFLSSNILIHKKGDKKTKLFRGSNVIGLNDLLWYNWVGNQVFVKKERVISVGGFDEDLKSAQDYDLWLKLIIQYGPSLRVANTTYSLFVDHDEPRITLSKNKNMGMIQFFNKYKQYMSNGQRKFHYLRRMFWSDKKRFLMMVLFNFSPFHLKFLYLYLKNRKVP